MRSKFMQTQHEKYYNSNLVERFNKVIIIAILLLGVLGHLFTIISLNFPWITLLMGSFDGRSWLEHNYFPNSFYFGINFSLTNSYPIESVFGLIITIGLVLIWWKKPIRIFSSIITLGVLILPSRIINLLIILVRNRCSLSVSAIPEFFLFGCWVRSGAFINLSATIFLILMVGLSFLGLALQNNKNNKVKVVDVRGVSIVSFCSLLPLVPLTLPLYFDSYYSPHILILITVSLLLTTFIKDFYSRNFIIPLYLTILGVELFLTEKEFRYFFSPSPFSYSVTLCFYYFWVIYFI